MTDEIQFGIVGCCTIGPWHAKAISDTEGARLVAVCDRVRENAEKLAEECPDVRIYADFSEMLSDPQVQVVCICTPSGTHTELGIQAAAAGKHILVEKPVGIDLAAIDELIHACRKARVKLGVIFQLRTTRLLQQVREAVVSGRLGKMVLGDAYVKYYRKPEYYVPGGWRGTWALDGGGALMNQGIHCVDLIQWVMGPVRSVFARTDHLIHNIEVEDTAVAALKFESGAFGVIEATTAAFPGFQYRLEFHGERGTIRVEGDRLVTWEIKDDDSRADVIDLESDVKVGSAASSPTAIGTEGHRCHIEDMVGAIKEDRDPMVTGEEARKAVEIILAIYRSARTGAKVALPLGD